MCLSGGFLSAFSLVNIKVVQSGFEFWMRCSHVLMFGPMVMISANKMFGVGWCRFWCIYEERLGNILEVLIWLWWFIFSRGENVCVMCWYSGCNFIVDGMKYVLDLCLCAGGCSLSMLGKC